MPWLTGWTYRKEITIPAASVTGTHTNFPVAVQLGDDADLIAHALESGADIRVTDSDGETLLPYHLIPKGHMPITDGAWTWFNDPRAVYSSTYNKTFIAAHGRHAYARVAEINHATGNWTVTPVNNLSSVDDHLNSAILCLDANGPNPGKLLLCNSQLIGNSYWTLSTNAGDATSWGSTTATGATSDVYCDLVQLGADDSYNVYWFFRRSTSGEDRDHMMRISSDGGSTWGSAVQIFESTNKKPYFQIVQNGSNRIDFFCTDDHPESSNTSIWHFYRSIDGSGNESWHKSDGTLIGDDTTLPLTTADVTQVYDGSTTSSWVWDAAVYGGSPVLAFTTFANTYTDHYYHQARWNGSAWVTQQIATGGDSATADYLYAVEEQYSGGIALDPDDIDAVVVSREVDGVHEIQRYELTGTFGSGSWGKTEDITSESTEKNIRPYYVRGATGLAARLLWVGNGPYNAYTDYRTGIRAWPPIVSMFEGLMFNAPNVGGTDQTAFLYYGKADATQAEDPAAVYPADIATTLGFVPVRGSILDMGQKGTISADRAYGERWSGATWGQGWALNVAPFSVRTNDRLEISNYDFANKSALSVIVECYKDASGGNHRLMYGWDTTKADLFLQLSSTSNGVFNAMIAEPNVQVGAALPGVTVPTNTPVNLSIAMRQTGTNWQHYGQVGKTKGTVYSPGTPVTTNFDSTASSPILYVGTQGNTSTNNMNGGVGIVRIIDGFISEDYRDTWHDLRDGSAVTLGTEEEEAVDTTATPDPVSITFSVPTPAVRATVKPDPVVFTFSVATPSIRATAKPSPVSLTFSTATPTIRATVKPDPVAITFSVPTPTLPGQSITVTPDPVVFSFSIPTPRVLATVKPSPVSMVFGVTSPSIRAVVKPSAVAITFSVPTPTIGGAASFTQADIGWTSLGHKRRRLEWTA